MPLTNAARGALRKAAEQSQHGPRYGEGECMMRTHDLYGAPAIGDFDGNGRASAVDGWKYAKHKHPFDGDYAKVPRGVPFWWSGGSEGDGHVVACLGGGECWSTDIKRTGFYDRVPLALIHEQWGLTPLGWTEDIDGVTAWTPPAPKPHQPGPNVVAGDKAAAAGQRYAKRHHQTKRAGLWAQLRAIFKKLGARP